MAARVRVLLELVHELREGLDRVPERRERGR